MTWFPLSALYSARLEVKEQIINSENNFKEKFFKKQKLFFDTVFTVYIFIKLLEPLHQANHPGLSLWLLSCCSSGCTLT